MRSTRLGARSPECACLYAMWIAGPYRRQEPAVRLGSFALRVVRALVCLTRLHPTHLSSSLLLTRRIELRLAVFGLSIPPWGVFTPLRVLILRFWAQVEAVLQRRARTLSRRVFIRMQIFQRR